MITRQRIFTFLLALLISVVSACSGTLSYIQKDTINNLIGRNASCEKLLPAINVWVGSQLNAYELKEDSDYPSILFHQGICFAEDSHYSDAIHALSSVEKLSTDSDLIEQSRKEISRIRRQYSAEAIAASSEDDTSQPKPSNKKKTGFGPHNLPLYFSLESTPSVNLNLCLHTEAGISENIVSEIQSSLNREFKIYDINISFPPIEEVLAIAGHLEWIAAKALESPCDRLFLVTRSSLMEKAAKTIKLTLVGDELGYADVYNLTKGVLYAKPSLVDLKEIGDVAIHEFYHLLGCEHGDGREACYKNIVELKKLKQRSPDFFPSIVSDELSLHDGDRILFSHNRDIIFATREQANSINFVKHDELLIAIGKKDVEEIESILASGYDLNNPHYVLGRSPLFYSAMVGDTDVFNYLLNQGAEKYYDENGRDLLHEFLLALRKVSEEDDDRQRRQEMLRLIEN